jgi:hypothetical protein
MLLAKVRFHVALQVRRLVHRYNVETTSITTPKIHNRLKHYMKALP